MYLLERLPDVVSIVLPRGRVIGFNTVLDAFQADAWRYVLTALAPETNDVEFTWDDFIERVNSELVANFGNLVNRVLGFASKRFDGVVPTPGALDEVDQALLDDVRAGLQTPVVQRQLDLLKWRNTFGAFGFDAECQVDHQSPERLRITWRKDGHEAVLDADLSALTFTVTADGEPAC